MAGPIAALLLLPTAPAAFSADPEAAPSFSVVLPAAASVHGVPPAFFHSDLVVFNRSAGRTAVVRATYRCASASCDESPRIFAVLPRQVLLLEEVVGRFFEAPDTSGAIEFSSTEPIVVASRLYTPERPAPTLGMYVPGLGPEKAFVTSNLVGLSHSADPSVGFRTNVAVFNPSDDLRNVFIVCRDFRFALLGSRTELVPPHRLLQINDSDLFREFDVQRSVPSFHCTVSTDSSLKPLYAWAAVIDNRSNDGFFVTGKEFFATPPVLTLPAAASLHGALGTFFQSEMVVFNDDILGGARVTALYRCFLGNCKDSERTFTLGPGEMQVFPDVVGSFFGVPESAGSIEIYPSGHVTVSSRLYTPGPVVGTVGMFVPALDPQAATTSQVIPLVTRGSRVNVGVFNREDVPQVVTVRVFSDTGQLLGTLTRLLFARQGTQLNDVFHELGAAAERSAAYCLVEGNAPFRVFSYAAIVDNLSQDPILVPGQDDPERPPIE